MTESRRESIGITHERSRSSHPPAQRLRSPGHPRRDRGVFEDGVLTMSAVSLAQRLVGEGNFAIVCAEADSADPSRLVPTSSFDDDLPVLAIPLEVLLDDARGLAEALEDPKIERAELVLLVPPFGRTHLKPRRSDMSEIAARNVVTTLAPDKRFGSVLLPRSIAGLRPASLCACA